MNAQNSIPQQQKTNNNDNINNNQQNNQQQQSSNNHNKLLRESSQKQNSNNLNNQQDQIKVLCNFHGKKLEAFCEKDLQVLCIDCILSDAHKSHEIISVQKAAEKQRQQFYDEVNSAQKTEEKLRFILSDIKRHVGELHSTADKNRKELSQIYSYVRDLILEREQTLKRQISENLTKEEQDCEDKSSEINEFMGGINQLKQELNTQNQEHDIEVLLKAKDRASIASEVNGQRSRDLVSFNVQTVANCSLSLQEIKRESELSQLSRIIGPNYKGPTIGQTIGSSSAQSNLYSHTASTANKMKKANTQGQTQMSSNFPQGLGVQNPFSQQNEKIVREDARKVGKSNQNLSSQLNNNQVKTKVSPHRVQQKKGDNGNYNKKQTQGVMILDQNKQKSSNTQLNKNSSKCQGSFGQIAMQNQINLHNFNQYGHHQQSTQPTMGGQQDDMTDDILGNIGPEDVSSIYPLETNECQYYYQDNQNGRNPYNKRDESVANLNDLLESLNKSSGQQEINMIDNDKIGNSTASETGGSHSDIKTPPPQDFKFNKTKSTIESPKQKKGNAWKNQQPQQKIKSGKKNNFKKDNSTTDFEDTKIKNAKLIQLQQNENQQYLPLEETKNEIRSGSLNRYGSNGLFHNDKQSSNKKQMYKGQMRFEDSDNKSLNTKHLGHHDNGNAHQLCSLSQERAKRKQQKMGIPSQEQSPFKLNQVNVKESSNIMEILQECTKGIDKLEFINKEKRPRNTDSASESPVKLVNQNSSKAAVCVVDLTRRDDIEEFNVRKNDDRDQIIKYNEEEEGSHSKNLPNQSPLKQNPNSQSSHRLSTSKSPNQNIPVLKSTESLDNIMLNCVKNQDNSLEVSKSHNIINLGVDNFLHQSVSVDTSVSDPFRAFCKIKEEFIFVFSGFNDSKLLTCEALDVQRGTWKEICQIGKARTKFSAVPISKSRILIFGGKQADGQRTGEIEEYNLKTNKFKTLPFKLPKPRSGFSACVKREEGKIFFCGGNSGSVLKKFDCLDLKKGKWSRWPEMIQKRDELAVALGPDGKIYAIGGYGGGSSSSNNKDSNINLTEESKDKNQSSNCLRTAERFDFNTGEWEMLPEMNEARRALAAVALPDGIYAIGGYDGKQYLSSVEKFDLQKQQWIPVKSMNTSRCTLSAVVSSDCQYIYAIGGFNGNSLDLVERYNTMTDEWEFITPMISKRFMHEAVCLVTH